MKFSSKNPNYSYRFVHQILQFVRKYELFKNSDPLLIAVSGGVDSVVLLYSILSLRKFGYSNKVRVIHINHNSRKGQDAEARFVKSLCHFLKVECLVRTVKGLSLDTNFENNARIKRYDAFGDIAKPDEKILLAHHIDDSFEWTMLQSLRSSNIEGLVGIPVINRRVIRPLMCVTKRHIENYARCLDIPYMTDPTNEQIKYERNFIRHEVISAFKDRYPKYLKHYVYRHNEIARRLGLHLIEKHQSSFHISFSKESVLIFNLSTTLDTSGVSQLVIKGIKHLNPNGRGRLNKQLIKLTNALENHKQGPMVMSSGIKAYLDFNLILLTRKKDDAMLVEELSDGVEFNYDQFFSYLHGLVSDKSGHLLFPFIFKISRGRLDERKFNTSFNVGTVSHLKRTGVLFYPGLRLLREWSKKRNRHKVLRLNLMGFPA